MKHFLLTLTAIISLGSCTQQHYVHKIPRNLKKHPTTWTLDRSQFLYFRDKHKLNNRIFSGVSQYNNPLFYQNRNSNNCSTNW